MTTRTNAPEAVDGYTLYKAASCGSAVRVERRLRIHGIWVANTDGGERAFLRCRPVGQGLIAAAVDATGELILIVSEMSQISALKTQSRRLKAGRFARCTANCVLTQILGPRVRIVSPKLARDLGLEPFSGQPMVNLAIAEEVHLAQ